MFPFFIEIYIFSDIDIAYVTFNEIELFVIMTSDIIVSMIDIFIVCGLKLFVICDLKCSCIISNLFLHLFYNNMKETNDNHFQSYKNGAF